MLFKKEYLKLSKIDNFRLDKCRLYLKINVKNIKWYKIELYIEKGNSGNERLFL